MSPWFLGQGTEPPIMCRFKNPTGFIRLQGNIKKTHTTLTVQKITSLTNHDDGNE